MQSDLRKHSIKHTYHTQNLCSQELEWEQLVLIHHCLLDWRLCKYNYHHLP